MNNPSTSNPAFLAAKYAFYLFVYVIAYFIILYAGTTVMIGKPYPKTGDEAIAVAWTTFLSGPTVLLLQSFLLFIALVILKRTSKLHDLRFLVIVAILFGAVNAWQYELVNTVGSTFMSIF